MEWSSWTWWNHSWYHHLNSALYCIHLSAHSTGVYTYHVISRILSYGTVLGCSPSGPTEWHSLRHSTVGQLLYSQISWGLKERGRRMQRQNSGSGIYNKTSQQLKVLNMNKMPQRVTHFQASLRTNPTIVFMVKSPRKHVHHSSSVNGIFSVFPNKNEKQGSTKWPKKIIIMHSSTKEN